MKKITKKIAAISVIVCLTLCFADCTTAKNWKFDLKSPNEKDTEFADMHTSLQNKYLNMNYTNIDLFADGKAELSRPAPISLEWTATANGKTPRKVDYTVEISKNEDFTDCIRYKADANAVNVYNLEIGAKYFWRVEAKTKKGSQTSETANFTTADIAPRNLYIDGVTNVRDLGGWKTENGNRVRQGKIYRCGRLNKSETNEIQIEITENGINAMKNELKIVTEIDLRMPNAHNIETGGITSSPLGDGVAYRNIPMDWLKNGELDYLSNESYYPAIREFFSVLSDEKNYPLIFHCNIGTDRTGLFAYLINGLLGVKNTDLYRDYLFSNFADIGGSRSIKNMTYVNRVMSFDGNDLSEKIERCLLDIGVKKSDIDALRHIMTEPKSR